MASSDDSRQRAFLVTQRLITFVRQHDIGLTDIDRLERRDGFAAPRFEADTFALPEAEEIYMADVTFNTEQFVRSLNTCRRARIPFPIIATSRGAVPVDVGSLIGLANPWLYAEYDQRATAYLTNVLAGVFAQPPFTGLRVSDLDPDEAAGYFGDHLNEFLFARFQARESNISQKPGRQFTVTTNTYGLRVHYSPAYFFTPNNVFGSPSTPVKAWIQPGIYVFGATGPGVPLRFDTQSHYQIPPIGNAHLNM